jgi:membrane peptidoglycan carboxypeptidase
VTGVWVGFDQPRTIVSNGYAGELAVPIWAGFMKRATKGDKSEWLDRPSNVVGVNVCRMSGQLPNTGCDSVQVVRNGMVETRSMIYTEYFEKGTQPTTLCPLHEAPSLLDRLAGVFGKDSRMPVPADAAGLPTPPTTSTTGAASAPAGASVSKNGEKPEERTAEEPKKKRGFWSRLFGGGGDKDKKEDEDRKKQEEKRKQDEKKKKEGDASR